MNDLAEIKGELSDDVRAGHDCEHNLHRASSIPLLLAEIESPNAFRIVGTLQYFGMLEAADDIIVTGLPMFFHGPARKLVILRSSFVALGVINKLNDIIDIFIGFFRKKLYCWHCLQVIGKML